MINVKIRTLSGTILATVIALHAFGASGTNVFPAARGVLQRFAGEDVAEKFVFMRIEADEPLRQSRSDRVAASQGAAEGQGGIASTMLPDCAQSHAQ